MNRRALITGAAAAAGAALIPASALARPKRRRPPRPTPTPTPPPTPTATPAPAGALSRWFDSDWGAKAVVPPREWWIARKAEGYEGYLTTLHTFWGGVPRVNLLAGPSMDHALAVGLEIATYERAVEHAPAGLDAFRGYWPHIEFNLADVEFEADGRLHPVTEAILQEIAARGIRPVIYSYDDAWRGIMGGTTAFSAYPCMWVSAPRTGWPSSFVAPNHFGMTTVAEQIRFNVNKGGYIIDDDLVARSILK